MKKSSLFGLLITFCLPGAVAAQESQSVSVRSNNLAVEMIRRFEGEEPAWKCSQATSTQPPLGDRALLHCERGRESFSVSILSLLSASDAIVKLQSTLTEMEVRSFRLEGSAGVGDDAYLLEYGGRQRALYFRQGGTLVYVFDAPMRLVERVAKGIAQMLPAV